MNINVDSCVNSCVNEEMVSIEWAAQCYDDNVKRSSLFQVWIAAHGACSTFHISSQASIHQIPQKRVSSKRHDRMFRLTEIVLLCSVE